MQRKNVECRMPNSGNSKLETRNSELSPAVAHLVKAAREYSLIDFSEQISLHEGRYAADIIEQALENLDRATCAGNFSALRRKLKELRRENR